MAGRKEYELLLKLKAALGGNFSSTFQTAMNTTKQLQNSLQSLKKMQGDISAYKKTADAISTGKGKVQELTAEHDKLKGRLSESSAKVKELEKALDKSAKATGKETEEYKRLESELKKAKEDKERFANQTSKTAAAVDRASGKVTEQEQKLNELTKTLQAAGINTAKLTDENNKLQKAYERVKKSQEDVARVNQRLDKNAAAITATKSELTKTLGGLAAGGAAFYGGAIKPAMEFESAFAGVKKTINGTPEQLLKIQNGIRKMATQIPLGTTEISAIAEAAGQLGIKTDSILGFTRVMADLGVTTNLAGEEAASTLAKFANITGMAQGNFDRLGSTIVSLGNNLATTEADIAAMGLRLAGAGKQVGLSEAQILSYAGALSSVGIEAEAGGSAFSKVMVDMQLAVETGNEDLTAFAKVAGISAADFKKAFQTDAAGAINLFIKGLSNTKDGGESAIKVLDDMGITEVRMRDALLRAAGASDVFTQSLEVGTKAWEENKALTEEAAQRYKTTESSMKIMRQAFNDIGISLGSVFLPKLAETAQKVSELALRFSEFAQKNPELVKALVGTVAGLGVVKAGTLAGKLGFLEMEKGVLTAVKGLFNFKAKAAESAAAAATGGGKIANYFKGIKSALGGVDASMSKFNFAKNLMAKFDAGSLGQVIKGQTSGILSTLFAPFNALGGKVGGVLAPVAGKVSGIFGAIANGPLGKIGGVFQSLGGAAGSLLGGPLKGLGSLFGGLFGKAMPIVMIISALSMLFLKLSGEDISGFIVPLKEAFEQMKPVLKVAMEQFKELGNQLLPLLMDAAKQLAPILGQIVTAILPVVLQLIQSIVPLIIQLVQQLLPVILNIMTTLAPLLANIITTILPIIVQLMQTLLPIITQLVTQVLPIIIDVLNMLMPIITQLIQTVLPVLMTILQALMPIIQTLANLFGAVLGAAIEGVKPIIEGLLGCLKGVIDFIVGVFTGDWSKAWEGIKGIFSGVIDAIVGVWNTVVGIFKSIGDFFSGGDKTLNVNVNNNAETGVKSGSVPQFAKGTNYTPDTFIAGDVGGKGGELVTGARGRKVFTAAQTDAIFANINRIKAINSAASETPSLQAIPSRSGGGAQSFTIQYSPTIYVDGNKPGDLEEKLKQNNESLLQMFKEFLRRERENERRMAYA